MSDPRSLSPAARRLHVVIATLILLAAGACKTRSSTERTEEVPTADVEVVHEDDRIDVEVAGKQVQVAAEWTFPEGDDRLPIVLMVPGGGNVSRRGTRASDGAEPYAEPVDVTRALATQLAKRGFITLAWDKRTCGPRDTPLCGRYPTTDLDVAGPRSLSADVDAACHHAMASERSDGRIILWAHGQAAQIALASLCAEQAKAMVLVAPIPRRVDKVMVASLWARATAAKANADKTKSADDQAEALELKNRTASREAMFKAMEAGQFAEQTRVLGATLQFWTSWMTLTAEIPGDAPRPARPWIVVLGAADTQYAPTDHERIRALGALEGATLVEVAGADHHLLTSGHLDPASIAPILDRIDEALEGEPFAASADAS